MKMCFAILDFDGDGILNVLNLLHLQKNIPSTSLLGMEIMNLFDFYMRCNIYSRTLRDATVITFDVYDTKTKTFSLREEIRSKFLGIGLDLKT